MNKIINNNILLSISILTYNQPKEVERALESMLPQISKENKEIEIIINDNSDNFETENIIKGKFPMPFIYYFKSEGEKTFDANVLNAINNSKGEYIWLFGDDKIEPEAISSILKIIKNDKYNFIFTNFYITDQGSGKPAIKLNSDEIIDNGSIVLEKIANVLGFISSSIIRKDCLSNIDRGKMNKFMGFGYANFYAVLHVLSLPGLFYVCSFPYVSAYAVPVENMTEKYKRDAFKAFAVYTSEIINSFNGKFDKKSVKKFLAKNFGHIWRGMLVGVVNERGISKEQVKILFKYYWNFSEFWVVFPFFFMPRFVNVFFYKAYRKAKQKNTISFLAKVPWF